MVFGYAAEHSFLRLKILHLPQKIQLFTNKLTISNEAFNFHIQVMKPYLCIRIQPTLMFIFKWTHMWTFHVQHNYRYAHIRTIRPAERAQATKYDVRLKIEHRLSMNFRVLLDFSAVHGRQWKCSDSELLGKFSVLKSRRKIYLIANSNVYSAAVWIKLEKNNSNWFPFSFGE